MDNLSAKTTRTIQRRFGIGEWYGKSFTHLTPKERRAYAEIQLLPKDKKPIQTCPFLSKKGKAANCWKPGGICSLRLYEKSMDGPLVTVDSKTSTLRTTCPSRFEQDGTIYKWIGKTLLETENIIPVGETPFLERPAKVDALDSKTSRKVGRIDNVLVVPGSNPLNWCPVEKQAVYFSGEKMQLEFEAMARASDDVQALPFPIKNRRPDYRSSGPKRLLPQLEIKVPILSTWGRKMAVVIDRDFFDQLGRMEETNDLSNAELVWFVVQYVQKESQFVLEPKNIFITRLEDAIKGLIAAVALPKSKFEESIRAKLQRLN